eukprot:COSAG02_NODE_2338_length_9108_cov_17.856699_4_plen_61_part_00
MVLKFAPPASARDLDFKLTVSLEESSDEAKTQAKNNIADGQGGDMQPRYPRLGEKQPRKP